MNKGEAGCVSAYLEVAKLVIFNEALLDLEILSMKVFGRSVITFFELRPR
jgi:hypothetical protein